MCKCKTISEYEKINTDKSSSLLDYILEIKELYFTHFKNITNKY